MTALFCFSDAFGLFDLTPASYENAEAELLLGLEEIYHELILTDHCLTFEAIFLSHFEVFLYHYPTRKSIPLFETSDNSGPQFTQIKGLIREEDMVSLNKSAQIVFRAKVKDQMSIYSILAVAVTNIQITRGLCVETGQDFHHLLFF